MVITTSLLRVPHLFGVTTFEVIGPILTGVFVATIAGVIQLRTQRNAADSTERVQIYGAYDGLVKGLQAQVHLLEERITQISAESAAATAAAAAATKMAESCKQRERIMRDHVQRLHKLMQERLPHVAEDYLDLDVLGLEDSGEVLDDDEGSGSDRH